MFGFLVLAVTVASTTFRGGVPPVLASSFGGTTMSGSGSGIAGPGADSQEDLTVYNCKFISCTSTGGNEKSAVWCKSHGKVNVTLCYFEKCNGGNGFGTAIYSESPTFCFDYCEVFDCTAKATIVHFRNTNTNTAFDQPITLTGNVFRSCQAGDSGSGLFVYFPTNIAFVDCTFSDCTCNGNKAAVSLTAPSESESYFSFQQCNFTEITSGSGTQNGGAIYLSGTSAQLELQDVWFESCAATDGAAIYVDPRVIGNATIDNVTVIACEGTKDGSYSMVFSSMAENVEFRNLHLKSMPNGNGRLKIQFSESLNNVVLWNCSFDDFLTQDIFDWGVPEGKYLQFDFNLTDCRFLKLVVSKSGSGPSFFIRYDESKLQLKNFAMCRCEFESVTVKGSLIDTPREYSKNTCTVSEVTFKDTITSKFEQAWANTTYPLLGLSGFLTISITHVHFSDIHGTDNGFLHVH